MKKNLLIGGCAALVLVALSAFGLWHTQGDASYHMDSDLAQFGVSYTVEPTDIESKIVSVSIELTPDKLSPDRMFYLDIGEVEASEPVCTDADGTEIALNNLGSAWEIGPVSEDCESVVFQYDVKLGENTGVDFQVDGDLYEDLLAFQGKKVLMMPLFDSNNLTHMEKYISSVSFQLAGGSDWNAIIPFAPANSSEKSFQLERPTWYDYYDLINSSYCFGSFEPLNLSSGGENAVFYLDSAIRESAELSDLSMVISFYNYYTGVFGSNLDKPVVLLRTNEDGESTILSGVGGQSAAISLSMYTPDACQTMSRTLYHAFFDSKVHARNLHYQPNEWLYRGLGDRYVNASAEALPPGAEGPLRHPGAGRSQYPLHEISVYLLERPRHGLPFLRYGGVHGGRSGGLLFQCEGSADSGDHRELHQPKAGKRTAPLPDGATPAAGCEHLPPDAGPAGRQRGDGARLLLRDLLYPQLLEPIRTGLERRRHGQPSGRL